MHLDENDVARYVDGRITGVERKEVEAHLADCPECSDQVAEARQTLDEVRGQEVPALDSDVRRKAVALGTEQDEERDRERPFFRPAVIAGTLVMLLGLAGILYWQLQEPNPSRLRVPTSGESLTTRAPADGARISERPILEWEEISESLAYRVTVYAPDGSVLWREDTTATQVPLPPEISLSEGQTYLWRATALRSDGTSLRSNLRSFTYEP